MRPLLLALALVFLLLASCGDDAATVSGIDSPEYLAFREQATACGADRPGPAEEMTFAGPDDLGITGLVTAVLHTSCGDVTIELVPDVAPATVNSFVYLAEQGYFDGTVSHRIFAGFVVQMGDPTATGRGSPGYRIVDELPTPDFTYVTGVVAMANGGPNSGGSQFFIMLGDSNLPPDYTVFGFVVGGFDVLDRIATVPVGANPNTLEPSYPRETLYLESVTIER